MPSETRYARSDTHTINTYTYLKLLTSQSGVSGDASGRENEVESSIQVDFKVSVWRVQSDGTKINLLGTTLVGSRTFNGEGIQSITWDCPETALNVTDAIEVDLAISFPSTGFGTIRRTITEQLGASKLNAATWTIYFYTWRQYPDPGSSKYTEGRIYYDTATYNTRITNFSYEKAAGVVAPNMAAKMMAAGVI